MRDLYVSASDRDVTLSDVFSLMRRVGVTRLLVKDLSPNDNSKNQPYFGSDFSSLNVIPTGELVATQSISRRAGAEGATILKAPVTLSWMDRHGQLYAAPHAKLILYPQYPEVRFSGFLRKVAAGPATLMDSKRLGRSRGRILFLGIRDDGQVIGYMAAPDSQLARGMAAYSKDARKAGVFRELILRQPDVLEDGRERLLQELIRIHNKQWIDAKHLKSDGTIVSCTGPRCVGHTLEAELGIVPNARSAPDFAGWEIKAVTVGSFQPRASKLVTLMTPEPTGALYAEVGAAEFVRRFGAAGASGTGRWHFTGKHVVNEVCGKTGLTLQLLGYDSEKGKISDPSQGVALIARSGEPVALWHYTKLIDIWKRKHNLAAYVPARARTAVRRQFWYGNFITLGVGTDFLLLLKALASGLVCFDPGTSLGDTVHARSQFRIAFRDIARLYHEAEEIDLTEFDLTANHELAAT